MIRPIKTHVLVFSIFLALCSVAATQAEPNKLPSDESQAFDLVNAVNALRAAYGLPAYSINSILMFTAQNQADFMAATGNVTHSGPGSSSYTERLLAAGYALGGDLSQGGFRAENITSGNEGMSAQAAVDSWMGDGAHQNTMLSQDLTEIGAGVAVVNGRVYYVIDCARSVTSGAPPASTAVFGSGTTVPANDAPIFPVVVNTPNASGDVIHEVKSGQTLWQIAISYGVKIDDIKRLNNLLGNDIYPADRLLIKKEATPTAAPATDTATLEATSTAVPSATHTPTVVVGVSPTAMVPARQTHTAIMTAALAMVALAILGAGVLTGSGRSKEDPSS